MLTLFLNLATNKLQIKVKLQIKGTVNDSQWYPKKLLNKVMNQILMLKIFNYF